MIACANCGTETPTMMHRFFEGLGYESRPKDRAYRPAREWAYEAALYHHPVTHASYCGPACATKALAP